MFETTLAPLHAAPPHRNYRGPERRSSPPAAERWMAAMLDEVDYGMLLVDEDGVLLHANRAARAELDASHPLQLSGRALRARHGPDGARLMEALAASALRGLRRLLALGEGPGRISVAVVPVGPSTTLVVLGRRRLSERLSVQCFAKEHALTHAETRVLEALCDGTDPREIAQLHQVGLATVRTQISSIREKTGAANIRALVRQVAVLPPLLNVLRAL